MTDHHIKEIKRTHYVWVCENLKDIGETMQVELDGSETWIRCGEQNILVGTVDLPALAGMLNKALEVLRND